MFYRLLLVNLVRPTGMEGGCYCLRPTIRHVMRVGIRIAVVVIIVVGAIRTGLAIIRAHTIQVEIRVNVQEVFHTAVKVSFLVLIVREES